MIVNAVAATMILGRSASGDSGSQATMVVAAARERNSVHSNQRPAQPTAGISITSGNRFMPACTTTNAASDPMTRLDNRIEGLLAG